MSAWRRRAGSTAMSQTPTSRKIVEDIRAQIESGQLAPGAKLPKGDDLKAQYKVSDTPVKTAIAMLEGMGLIVRRQGVGWFVAER